MNKVKVLIEGYAKEIKKGWLASSSAVLIQNSGLNIIVDPGINKKLLLSELKKEGLTTKDINIVFLTHYHPDHAYLAAIFENSILVDGDTVYEKDKETEYQGKIPGTSLKTIATPGHSHEHYSLLINTDKGKIVVAGDVFWWMDNEKQKINLKKEDPFTKDRKALIASRKKLLEVADWIIPGHGKMFKNPYKEGK